MQTHRSGSFTGAHRSQSAEEQGRKVSFLFTIVTTSIKEYGF